ncbi:hypothetical protein H2199_003781 [Coniosporium tulheliwenetii]|uniref:Uncharacterized protein n=1 Tax=Coniosporium tulheliwenetii TaxID=3383036 RepID=A0ACC2Z9A8_9PEZI|nr:hypothetical protein H2199_003781 [Cladosporium sp. JES 115]
MVNGDPDGRIILDEPNRVYTAGDIVRGHVLLEVGRRQESCIVAVTIYSRTKTRLHTNESAETHRGRCLLFAESQILRTPENGIPAGRHTLPFSLIFPSETSASQTLDKTYTSSAEAGEPLPRPRPRPLDRPAAPAVTLKSFGTKLLARTEVDAHGRFADYDDYAEDVVWEAFSFDAELAALGAFSKAEDWSKIVLLRLPEKGVSLSFKTYNIKRSYKLKVRAVVVAVEKELEVKSSLPVVVKGEWRRRVEEVPEGAGRVEGGEGEAPPPYREATSAW